MRGGKTEVKRKKQKKQKKNKKNKKRNKGTAAMTKTETWKRYEEPTKSMCNNETNTSTFSADDEQQLTETRKDDLYLYVCIKKRKKIRRSRFLLRGSSIRGERKRT